MCVAESRKVDRPPRPSPITMRGFSGVAHNGTAIAVHAAGFVIGVFPEAQSKIWLGDDRPAKAHKIDRAGLNGCSDVLTGTEPAHRDNRNACMLLCQASGGKVIHRRKWDEPPGDGRQKQLLADKPPHRVVARKPGIEVEHCIDWDRFTSKNVKSFVHGAAAYFHRRHAHRIQKADERNILIGAEGRLAIVTGADLDQDRKISRAQVPNLQNDFFQESRADPGTIIYRVIVDTIVHPRMNKLMNQITMSCVKLNAVKAGFARTPGSLGKSL